MSIKKKIIAFIIVILIAIQLYPVDKPEVIVDNPNDIIATTTVPKNIASKLKVACYDCHSNESKLPWYWSAMELSFAIKSILELFDMYPYAQPFSISMLAV